MSRRAVESVGFLDERLQYCMDYDLWIRLGRGNKVKFINDNMAYSRMYPDNKTLKFRRLIFQEIIRTVKRHYGYVPFSWVHGYSNFLYNGADQFFNKKSPAKAVNIMAYLLFVFYNLDRPDYVWTTVRQQRHR